MTIPTKFQLDITYDCNLACRWCDRLCGSPYAFSKDVHMTLDQLDRYIELMKPRIAIGSRIGLFGGEPTLHPQVLEIIDHLTPLKKQTHTPLYIYSNGVGPIVKEKIREIRKQFSLAVQISITKVSPNRNSAASHIPLFQAASDYPLQPQIYEPKHCKSVEICGHALTPYGAFVCVNASATAKLLHLDIGLKTIPTLAEFSKLQRQFCRYCNDSMEIRSNEPSLAWQPVLENYDPTYSLTLF